MTEKRFKSLNCGLQGQYIKDNGTVLTIDEVVELLNELNDENKELKQSNKEAWDLIQFIYNEIKEDGSMNYDRIKDLVDFE